MISSARSIIVMRPRRLDAIFSIHRRGDGAAASRACVNTAKFAEGALTPGIAYWRYENGE